MVGVTHGIALRRDLGKKRCVDIFGPITFLLVYRELNSIGTHHRDTPTRWAGRRMIDRSRGLPWTNQKPRRGIEFPVAFYYY